MSPSRTPKFVKDGPAINRAPDAPLTGRAAPPAVERTLADGGRPLEPALRHDMEQRFGCDFFDVRVHDDALAAASAKDLHAHAYAAGTHIVFAAGRYAPGAHEGRRLLAHELAHVVQQQVPGPAGAAEQRADHAAAEAMAGRAVDRRALGGAPPGIHAEPEGKAPAPAQDQDKPRDSNKPAENTAGNGRGFTTVLDQFAPDKDALTPVHMGAIEKIAYSISLHTGILEPSKAQVEIVGHTDTTDSESHNQKLGQDRADRVKEALEQQLAARQAPAVEWKVYSLGELAPRVPTGNNTREPLNRRVEVKVTFVPLAAPNQQEPIQLFPEWLKRGRPEEPEQEDPEQKRQRWQRRIDELNRTIGEKKSPQDVLVDLATSGRDAAIEGLALPVDLLINKLPIPDKLKQQAREGLRDAIRAGSLAACEATIKQAGATGREAEALKAACESAIKQKPARTGGGTP